MYHKVLKRKFTLLYDASGCHSFYEGIIGSKTIIGINIPTKIQNDETVEEEHIAFEEDNSDVYAVDKSTKHGSYYRIPPRTWVYIKENQYFIIGCTYVVLIRNPKNEPTLLFVDQNNKYVMGKAIKTQNIVYSVGKSAKCDIILMNDIHISREHLHFKIEMNKLYIYDNDSANFVWAKFDRILLGNEDIHFRIGLKTFLQCSYKEEAPLEILPPIKLVNAIYRNTVNNY